MRAGITNLILKKRRYRVLVHGRNLILYGDVGPLNAGCVATRYVDALNETIAKELVVKAIKNDPKIVSMRYPERDAPEFEVQEISEVGWWKRRFSPSRGFMFYTFDDEIEENDGNGAGSKNLTNDA